MRLPGKSYAKLWRVKVVLWEAAKVKQKSGNAWVVSRGKRVIKAGAEYFTGQKA